MRVLVDGKPHPILQVAPPSVAFVLAEIDEVLEQRGRAIRQVIVDGNSWPLDELADGIGRLQVGEVGSLEVNSEDLRVLVERSLTEVESVIDELPSACHTLASLLNSADREAALDSYGEFSDVWFELMERHRQVLAVLKLKSSSVHVAGMPLEAWHANVVSLVRRGEVAANARDAADLADLLGHDMAPYAEQEAEVIAVLRSLACGGEALRQ